MLHIEDYLILTGAKINSFIITEQLKTLHMDNWPFTFKPLLVFCLRVRFLSLNRSTNCFKATNP